jgi:hypothetical protein
MKMLRTCGIWCIQTDVLSIIATAAQLNFDKETVTFVEKAPNFGPTIRFSINAMLQLTKALSVKQCLAQNSIIEMNHSAYSPNLAPTDF